MCLVFVLNTYLYNACKAKDKQHFDHYFTYICAIFVRYNLTSYVHLNSIGRLFRSICNYLSTTKICK